MKFKSLLLTITFLPAIAIAQAPVISPPPVSDKPGPNERPPLAPVIVISSDGVSHYKTVDVVARNSNAVTVPVKAEAAPALPPFTPPPEISVQSEVNKTVGAPVAVKPAVILLKPGAPRPPGAAYGSYCWGWQKQCQFW